MPRTPLLELRSLGKSFGIRASRTHAGTSLRALHGVSLTIDRGEVLALVGESGSGKTTLGKMVVRLTDPSDGHVLFDGIDISALSQGAMKPFRKRIQFIFQDPYQSLNPYMRVGDILEEALVIHRLGGSAPDRRARVRRILEQVGLSGQHVERYPHEFSGGQRQRIGIARAVAVEPELIIADEPVSALDVSVQAQIISLLRGLQKEMNLALLFISHDLAVVRQIADRVAVLYLGRLLELAPTDEIFSNPRHPYTEALISAAPLPDPDIRRERIVLNGDIPSPLSAPSGCPFHTRCHKALPKCASVELELYQVGPERHTACWREAEAG